MTYSHPALDPTRQQLREVRRGLFRLHKTLIDAERAAFERTQGRLSNGQFLQALIEDPLFAWMRPFSTVLVEIDQALAAKEPLSEPTTRAYIEQVRALVAPVEGEEEPNRYDHLRQRNPDVLVAHVELTARIVAFGDRTSTEG